MATEYPKHVRDGMSKVVPSALIIAGEQHSVAWSSLLDDVWNYGIDAVQAKYPPPPAPVEAVEKTENAGPRPDPSPPIKAAHKPKGKPE